MWRHLYRRLTCNIFNSTKRSATVSYNGLFSGMIGGGTLYMLYQQQQQPAYALVGVNDDDEEEEDTPSPGFHAPVVDVSDSRRVYVMPSSQSQLKIFSPDQNYQLATEVALLCGTQLGRAKVRKFADGETSVQVMDNVRGKDVFLIHPSVSNDGLMELVLTVSTLKRASAARVTAVIPYYGYARQSGPGCGEGEAIAAADVALMLQTAGVDRIVSVDLHDFQIQGFFSGPVDNIDPTHCAVPYFLSKRLHDPVIVYPGNRAVFRAKRFQKHLARGGVSATLALVYGRSERGGFSDVNRQHHTVIDQDSLEIIGDVNGCDCIVVDDMIDSGSRVTSAARALKKHGARRVYAFATHGLFSGDCISRIEGAPLKEVVVLNTIPGDRSADSSRIRELTVSSLIAETIMRIHHGDSVSEMYGPDDDRS